MGPSWPPVELFAVFVGSILGRLGVICGSSWVLPEGVLRPPLQPMSYPSLKFAGPRGGVQLKDGACSMAIIAAEEQHFRNKTRRKHRHMNFPSSELDTG
eukprot:838255-Pyramimonas_sp.AAC.1